MNSVIVVIPAFEPDYRLIELIKDLNNVDVLVVDDGSGSEYKDVFSIIRQFDIPVISYKNNHGKGYALKTAFRYIRQYYQDKLWIISADADGQHTASDIVKIIKKAKKSNADLIIGTREFTGYMPLRSRIGNKISTIFYYLLTGKYISDTQSGLRAYRISCLEQFCKIKGNRYEYEINCLMQCKNIQSAPIETIYQKGNETSHYRVWKDSFLILKAMISTKRYGKYRKKDE